MILFGVKNDTHVLASVAHYDYRSVGEDDQYMMVDGGQPGTNDYAGYSRKSGKNCVFEVPQSFDELYNDWNVINNRKYGLWKIEDVRILNEEEAKEFWDKNIGEDRENDHYLYENIIWGTRGKNGDEPLTYKLLKDLEIDHLCAIKDTQSISNQMRKAILYWLSEKSGINYN